MKRRFLFLIALIYALQLHAATNFADINYIEKWGKLKLAGLQLSSENGDSIQLKGWSTHGWQFGDVRKVTFTYENGFEGMKSMGANVVRIAAYPSPYSQVNNATMNNIISWVKDCMKYTNDLGMYCIVDYHVTNPGYPLMYLKDGGLGRDAEDFFTQIVNEVKEKKYKHVIYEICNEPEEKLKLPDSPASSISLSQSWDNVKAYAGKILPIIGSVDPQAVVIVGTPTYDQRLDYAAGAAGSGKLILPAEFPNLNIMYAFHYYACSHYSQFTNYMKVYASQIPIFASEWSMTQANGSGTCANSISYSNAFLDFCRDQKISWCSWSWSAKSEEESSALKTGPYNADYVYSMENLTETGLFIANRLQEGMSSSVSDVKNIKFSIYPNPAKDGVFKISLEYDSPTTITISGIQGKTVYSSMIRENEATIDANLKSGIYIVSVKNDSGTGIQKLVVE